MKILTHTGDARDCLKAMEAFVFAQVPTKPQLNHFIMIVEHLHSGLLGDGTYSIRLGIDLAALRVTFSATAA